MGRATTVFNRRRILLDAFDLKPFLKLYKEALSPKGVIVIDVIDVAYNFVPNNQFLTSDWSKTENERASTEYKKRYSRQEVVQIAQDTGLHVIKAISHS